MTHLLPVTLGLPFLEFHTKGVVRCVGFFTWPSAFGGRCCCGSEARASSLPTRILLDGRSFPSPVGTPGWFPVGAVTDKASLTLHVTFCGLVHLLLLGRYLEVQLRGFCVACLTRGNQPDCLLPALVSTSNT